MYEYSATIERVIDADTFVALVDLGFNVFHRLTFRLEGIDAHEKNTPEGQEAIIFVKNWLSFSHDRVAIQTIRDRQEKYGRYLARIKIGGVDLATELVKAGHAKTYDGGKR